MNQPRLVEANQAKQLYSFRRFVIPSMDIESVPLQSQVQLSDSDSPHTRTHAHAERLLPCLRQESEEGAAGRRSTKTRTCGFCNRNASARPSTKKLAVSLSQIPRRMIKSRNERHGAIDVAAWNRCVPRSGMAMTANGSTSCMQC